MNSLRTISLSTLAFAACAAPPQNYHSRLSSWDRMHDERGDALADSPAEFDDGSDLEALLAYARAHNPGLQAAFLRWKEALERIPQADSLPNPRLSFGAYLSEVETRTGPMQGRIGLTQPLPWFGKRELKDDVAFEAAEASREMLEATRLELE